MKNNYCKWLILLWLFLLTLATFALIAHTQDTVNEQKAQREILAHQTEIIALNTMLLRAIVQPLQNIMRENE